MNKVTAFAPATVANVAVGFDILGFATDTVGDHVTVTKTDRKGQVEITAITNAPSLKDPAISQISLDANQNTATVGLLNLLKDQNLNFGLSLSIEKGIPLSSGMGGSAASAVAALVAANQLLDQPLTQHQLLKYAVDGEAVASGSRHADNIAPCLFGGMTLIHSLEPRLEKIVHIPFPDGVHCVLFHPDLKVNTKESRGILKKEVPLKSYIQQSAYLAGFISSCFINDQSLLATSLKDVLIEPQRTHLIPGFLEIQKAALSAGALGCSISGSGPSVFALAPDKSSAEKIKLVMTKAFEKSGVSSFQSWISSLPAHGARLIKA